MYVFFFSSRRRHTRCALVTGFRRVLFRSPAVGDGLVGAAILAVGQILGAGVARFDDVPAIGGGFGVVDDQHGGGALPRGFLIFVRPAAIIGHRAAVEFALGFLGLPVGIVDEDDDGLPLQDRKSTRLNSSH